MNDLPWDRATRCPHCGKYTIGMRGPNGKQQADELMSKHLPRCEKRPR